MVYNNAIFITWGPLRGFNSLFCTPASCDFQSLFDLLKTTFKKKKPNNTSLPGYSRLACLFHVQCSVSGAVFKYHTDDLMSIKIQGGVGLSAIIVSTRWSGCKGVVVEGPGWEGSSISCYVAYTNISFLVKFALPIYWLLVCINVCVQGQRIV